MTTGYTNVFGTDTVPPADASFASLTIAADTELYWPYNTAGATALAKVMEVTASAGSLSITLPSAVYVSVGEDCLLRNVGSNTFSVKNNGGAVLATLAAGEAKYFYLRDTSTEAGDWNLLTFGTGTSSADAGTLVGYGLKAIGATLNTAFSVLPVASDYTITSANRGELINYTGGSGTLSLPAAATAGDDFFFCLRNSGTGTLTIDPSGAETIDSRSDVQVQPGESLYIMCSGTLWLSVGYGRSTIFNYTQLTLDLTAASTPMTLTTEQIGNKIIKFTGTLTADFVVLIPAVSSVYYLYSAVSGAYDITVKVSGHTGVDIAQGQRAIVICDGVDVYSAQSASVATTLSILAGSAAVPSLNFQGSTNSGLYLYGTKGIGFTTDGVAAGYFDDSGNFGLAHDLAVTEGGTGASTASGARTNLGLAIGTDVQAYDADLTTWAGKTAPSGTVVGDTDTQTLTNKTLSTPIVSGVLKLPGSGLYTDAIIEAATAGAQTYVALRPATGADGSGFSAFKRSNVADSEYLRLDLTYGYAELSVARNGTTYPPVDLRIAVNSTLLLKLTTAGVVSLENGQLKFPSTQNPSADANTLDDYEEGTFTTTASATGCTFNATTSTINYRKIGSIVFCDLVFDLAASGNTLTGANAVTFTLPFASSSTVIGGGAARYWANAATALMSVTVSATASSSTLTVRKMTAAGTSPFSNLLGTDLANSFSLRMPFFYVAAD